MPTLRDVPETVAVARSAMEVLLRWGHPRRLPASLDGHPRRHPAAGLSIKDGIATVDLSREFESGGGSASTFYRLGQVVYTLTQFSTIDAVTFQVEGRTVTTFGSEGVDPRRAAGPRRLRGPAARDLRGPAGVRRGRRQPAPPDRQGQRLRGRVFRITILDAGGRRPRGAERDGDLRHRLPRDLDVTSATTSARRSGDAPRAGLVRQGWPSGERPRLPRSGCRPPG